MNAWRVYAKTGARIVLIGGKPLLVEVLFNYLADQALIADHVEECYEIHGGSLVK
jgi:hypothetical protein